MRVVDPLVAATAFLTRIPVDRAVRVEPAAVARAAPFYPLVGGAVGALGGAVVDVSAGSLPAVAAAALGLATVALLTGGMHLDALADTADGLGGGSRERSLEIMRDHAVGAYGAAAIGLDLLLKASLLAALLEDAEIVTSLVAAGALSRSVAPPLALALPYARPSGLGTALGRQVGLARVLIGLAIAVAIAVAALGIDALVVLAAVLALAVALALLLRRWLGGITGDTLGATIELAELTALSVAVALA
jgi:adenosylcobinamide-GDP ribazoletransferase